jgi:TPR repeat protein
VIQQSDTEAYLWARKAAERGLAKAEYALGYYTEVGIGVPANLEEAKRWYYKAATQQHPKAQSRLQELKKGGIAVQHSRERLSRSNVKSKDQGDCRVM